MGDPLSILYDGFPCRLCSGVGDGTVLMVWHRTNAGKIRSNQNKVWVNVLKPEKRWCIFAPSFLSIDLDTI